MTQPWESASSALSELTPPDFGDRTLVVWARVLLVGGGAILRGALPVHLPEFQILAVEGMPTNALAFLQLAAPDLVLVAPPIDADARVLINEIAAGGRVPLVALAGSTADAAALAFLEQEFADIVVLGDGDQLPDDLGARMLAVVRERRASERPAKRPTNAATDAASRLRPRTPTPDAAPGEDTQGRVQGELEQRLAASLRSLEDAHRQLQERAVSLERIVTSAGALRAATSREQLAQAALDVLAGLPGFGLVAIGLQDDQRGATEMMGVARIAPTVTIPLGRRTVMLDLLELAPERRRVSQSHVIEGCCIRIHGSPDTWGPRTARGEWDLSELFDGLAVAVTPLRAGDRSHGFLFVKAPGPGVTFDAESLRAVEILAHLAGASFDNLRLQEAERRRAEMNGRVNRLSRALIEMHDPDAVLRAACDALGAVLPGATLSFERVRGGIADPAVRGPMVLRPQRDLDDAPFALSAPQVAAQLVVPVRADGRARALVVATSPHHRAFDDLDAGALELFAEVVGKALASAETLEGERRGLQRLRLVSDIGRIASSSLEMDEVLSRALAHLCQQASYEHASVALIDHERGKLVLTAQASRAGGRSVSGLSTRLDQGVTGYVATSGAAMIVPDVTREPRYVAADPEVRSELCVPLHVADDVVGVLNVESRRLGAFDDEDLVVIASVGDHLAHALANSRLFRQVRDKNRMLRESERNKSEFLAIVAHDLRTPLTSIRSAADVLLMYGEEPQEVKQEFLEGIRDESARLGRLVDDFLTYSRMEEGVIEYDVQEFGLSEVVLHFMRVFEGPASQKGIELTCQLPASLPPVLADRERVSQVLANLLSNATRYVPDGGHVSVGARVLPAPEGAMMGTVQVDVADDGPGIEECHRERIFEKFVRLDGAKGGGAGLGLPIARAIVEHLGGRLWLDPAWERGARFVFTLPARLGVGM